MAGGNELNDIFNLCSPDLNGYILTESLIEKLTEQLDENDLLTLKNALDPNSEGKISFDQFTSAVTSMTENGCILGHSTELPVNERENFKDEYGSSSEPDSTYNEYDIPDGDDTAQSSFTENIGNSKSCNCINKSQYCTCEEHFSTPPFEIQQITIPRRLSNLKSHSRNSSLRHDPFMEMEDGNAVEKSGSMASDIEELSERVDLLKNHVAKLTEERKLQIQYETVNRENQQLVLRNHELEERVSNLVEKLDMVKKSHENEINMLLVKLTREHQLMEEVMNGKLTSLTKENENLLGEVNELKCTLKKLRCENSTLQSKADSLTDQVLQMNEEYMRLNKQSSAQYEKYDREISLLQATNEKMKAELEEVVSEKSCGEEILKMDSQPSSTAFLSAKLSNLEIENERLKCANEDLNGQLARNIVDARALLGAAPTDNSIANEMLSASRDEIVEALRKKEAENAQLKAYLDKIILSVLERDPSILEIK